MSTRCDGCERAIAGKAGDPVHAITGGKFCTECLRNRPAASAPQTSGRTRAEATRARWAAMTPEQKAERVAKLHAGRKAREREAAHG